MTARQEKVREALGATRADDQRFCPWCGTSDWPSNCPTACLRHRALAEVEEWEGWYESATDHMEALVAERDAARDAAEILIQDAVKLQAERDEAKEKFWEQFHAWGVATGKNQKIIDGLLARAEAAEAALKQEMQYGEQWRKERLAAEAEADRLKDVVDEIESRSVQGAISEQPLGDLAAINQIARAALGETP